MARRLRSSDIRLARSGRYHDVALNRKWGGKELKAYGEKVAKKMGYRIVPKSTTTLRLSKMTTTYYREIRVGTTYPSMSVHWQAALLMHELVHGRQWRHYRPVRFGRKYIFSSTFRWAMEMNGYSEHIWAMVALGASNDLVRGRIASCVRTMRKNYLLNIRRTDFERWTEDVLESAWNDARNGVK
jgi:hypothetical protein